MALMSIRRSCLAFALLSFAGCSQATIPSLPPAGGARAQSDGFKIRPHDKPLTKNTSAAISGAQNETVSFQIVVSATKSAVNGVNVAI